MLFIFDWSYAFNTLYFSIDFITQLERQNVMAAQTLCTALSKAENTYPGIMHDLILGIIQRAELNLDMNESVLRLQGAASDYDGRIFLLRMKDRL